MCWTTERITPCAGCGLMWCSDITLACRDCRMPWQPVCRSVALPSLCRGQHHLMSIYLQDLVLDTANEGPHIADSHIHSQASNRGIWGGQSCNGTDFCVSTIFLLPSCINASYSSIYVSLSVNNLGNWQCDDLSHPGNSFWDDSPFILDNWRPKNSPVLLVIVKASNCVQYFWCC